jgi:hypothetical protein
MIGVNMAKPRQSHGNCTNKATKIQKKYDTGVIAGKKFEIILLDGFSES